MKKILPIILILAIIISGCTQTGIIECDSNKTCFLNAQELCKKAKIVTTESQESVNNLTINGIISAEIKSGTSDNCVLDYKINKFEISGDTSQYPQQLLDIANSFNQASMTCTIPGKVELTINSLANIVNSCQGSLRTVFERLYDYYEALRQELERTVSKSFNIPAGGSYCVNGVITVLIMNTGTGTINKDDFTITVNDIDASSGMEDSIEPMMSGTFSWDCGGSCSSGSHAVYLETISSTQRITVTC